MTIEAYDPNKNKEDTVTATNVLGSGGTNVLNTSSSQNVPSNYVSDGNPYGQYATPSVSTSQPSANQATSRKTDTGASSGRHTNVQTYTEKNKESSQKLGGAVEGKLQNTADMVRQNTQNVANRFQGNVEQGSLQGYDTAVERSRQAFEQAASGVAPDRQYVSNEAYMYTPKATSYSPEDQALIDSNMARAAFGDGTTKDFATQSEAQAAINDWNRQNPGYYQYGDQEALSLSDKELSDILNAKYVGPTDLFQTQGYGDLYNQTQEAQALQDLAQSQGYKGELLKQTFAGPNTEYTEGQKLLDDLFLSQDGVNESLKQTASTLGQGASGRLADDFQKTVQDSRQLAVDRGQLMQDIRSQSRGALDEVATGRQGEVESRLNQVIQDWEKYPDYYRNKIEGELDEHDFMTKNQAKYKNVANELKNIKTYQNEIVKIQNTIPELQSNYNALLKDSHTGMKTPRERLSAQTRASTAKRKIDDAQRRIKELTGKISNAQSLSKEIQKLGYTPEDFANFNPNNLNLGLSELEAQMLGIQGGEGLYDLIRQGGIDSLIRTADYDKNRLISQDEQNQLARLQAIAQMTEGYGTADSGLNFRNQFTDRDVSGTQSALDALDMNYLRDQLQGREAQFREDAINTTLTGKGYGKATSGGLLGTKKETAIHYLSQNLEDLMNSSGGYRNIYSDEGIDQNRVNDILGLARGINTGEFGYTDNYGAAIPEGMTNAKDDNAIREFLLDSLSAGANPIPAIGSGGRVLAEAANRVYNTQPNVGGKDSVLNDIIGANPINYTGRALEGLGNLVSNLSSGVSGALFGSSKGLKKEAEAKALKDAQNKLKSQVDTWLKNQGVNNQFNVQRNIDSDVELLKLLGLLDTTNR